MSAEKGGYLTAEEITEWYGERCPDFEPGCPRCVAWARHDHLAAMLAEDQNNRVELKADHAGLPRIE
jgi:hypothetical protein